MSVDELYAAYLEGKLTTGEVKERLKQLDDGASCAPAAEPAWFALSEAQRGLWFLQQTAPEMSAYNIPVAIQLPAAVDDAAFVAACRRLLAQFPILTTAIVERDDGPRQIERKTWMPSIHREDVAHLGAEALLSHLKRLVRQPFSTDGESLLRIALLRRSSSQTIVIFNAHHVIFDGRSILPLVGSFIRHYQDALRGIPAEQPNTASSYRTFVAAERELIQSGEGAKRLSYWREQLRGYGEIPQLSTDRPRPAQRAFKGETYRYRVAPELTSRLRALCRATLVYPSTLFLGLFELLLARYTGAKDIVVGMPVDSRMLSAQPAAVGLFANMIPIRGAIEDTVALKYFLKNLQLTVINGIAQAYPFTALARELGLTVSAENGPLFHQTYAYQGAASEPAQDIEFIEELSQEGEYELGLEVYDRQREFGLNLKYDPDLFDGATVATLMQRYVTLLEAATQDPGRALRDYSVLSDAERQTVLVDWNDTQVERPENQCIFALFEQQARKTPQAVALRANHRTVSYAELSERSTALAALLKKRGLRGNQIVALCVERSVEMMIALLAIQKAGGAYLPLDPDYPVDRLAFMLQDSQAKIVLTQSKWRDRVSELLYSAELAGLPGIEVIALDEPWDESAAADSREPLNITVAPSDLVYVLYTSGSTGRPKGVMLEHRSLYNRIVWMQERYNLTPRDRVLQKTPLSFDVSGWELYWPLIVGAELAILPPGEHRDSSALIRFIDTQRITVTHFVPSMLETFLRTEGVEACRSLRLVFCSGEALTPAQCNLFFDRLPMCELHNLYGPTEAAIDVTYWRCEKNASVVPIGRPVANTRLYILDERSQPTPIGIAGELHIGGVGVARGYLNNVELTARKFIPDLFSRHPEDRLYKTGDCCRWRGDGTIEFLGRLDHQVKLRGLRIELGDVEAHLGSHPQIETCIAVISERDGHKQLVAWLVAARDAPQLRETQLRQFLATKLPEHMIPAAFAYLEKIPLTPSGKADRKALALRDLPQERQPATGGPLTEVEHVIAGIWRTLLRRADIELTRGFFDLGGDSLLAVSAINRINRQLGTRLTPTALFRYPSIKGLAAHVAAMRAGEAETAIASEAGTVSAPKAHPSQEADASSGGAGRGSHPPYYRDSLAIIGISCSVPGAGNHFDFWRNLTQGHEGVRLLTPAQLRAVGVPEELIANPRFVPASSSIDDKDRFDPRFFGISTRDALFMNPQFRLLLQHAWLAIEDAGYRAGEIPDTAVFMSESNHFYLSAQPGQADDSMESDGYVSWILAQGGSTPTMISHKLGLTGPSLAVHSNCSSSLVGLYSAYLNIRAGKCTTALVGASTILGMSAPGYLYHPSMNFSSDGHLKAFDAKADGMIAGEGVIVFLVKSAVDAIAQGDHIYALLRGIEVNNDGREKAGFYAPSFEGQSKVIRKVLATTGVDPETIHYVEAHGTGTKLGDPIELGALTEAYGGSNGRRRSCGVGSLKSNIGHLDTAAGLAGCLKVALSLHHGAIPPSINFSEPNPDIDFEHSPFYVVDRLSPWPDAPGPKRAAVSAFGIGGTNAHAILESYAAPSPAVVDRPVVIPISAKTQERLTAYVESVRDFLLADDSRGRARLIDLAYTLQVGREPMDCRVAFVADNKHELVAKLSQYLAGERGTPGVFRGELQRGETELAFFENAADQRVLSERWLAQGRIDKLAQLWVRGIRVEWQALHAPAADAARPRRISAPTYPFAKESFPDRGAHVAANEQPHHGAAAEQVSSPPSGATELSAHGRQEAGARASWDGKTYLVQWRQIPDDVSPRNAAFKLDESAVALIVCAGNAAELDHTIREKLSREHAARTVVLRLRAAPTERIGTDEWTCDSGDPLAISTCLNEISTVQALFFLTDAAGSGAVENTPDAAQLLAETQLYRLIKYLRNFGKVAQYLECFIVTFDHDDFEPSETQFAGGGATGLAYALAQREHRFRVRNIDLREADLANSSTREQVLQSMLNTPASDRGELIKVVPRGRFRQVFAPLAFEPGLKAGFAEHGVYVIAGGAGAVGRIITRGLIETYHARVVWLGRTPATDRAVQDKLAQFDRYGDRPAYIQADVTNPHSLRDAVRKARETHGRINGAMFMSIHIDGRAESLDVSEESEFLRSVSVKTQGATAFYAAFEHEPLDFMCYFSSAQAFSFSGASKLAALATGVTFADAFVRSLRSRAKFPVGTINWGAWRSSLGSALSEHMGSLTDEEGFACFQQAAAALQNGSLRQFVCLSVSPAVRGSMHCREDEQWVQQADGASNLAFIRHAVQPATALPEVFRATQDAPPVSFDEGLARRLLLLLRKWGVLTSPYVLAQPEALRETLRILPKYSRWWAECLRILESFGYIEHQDGKVRATPATFAAEREWVWAPWNQVRDQYLQDVDRKAYIVIAEACFDRLLEVLTGQSLATDVLFPRGSMKQMEGVYRDNAVADYFNHSVAQIVEASVRGTLERDPGARIRIVEIGAGTGGTTSKVLPRLAPHARSIEEYCYTDLSKAFLLMAEDQFRASTPYLTSRIWDIDKPIAADDPQIGRYDIAIATNVLHATKNVRRTLANAKTALRKNGVVVLNEGTRKNIYGSLIMGLLDGWWLYEDEADRIPGCPYLDVSSWQRVLTLEGFRGIYLPVDAAAELGQQVIVAESDGVIKVQRTVAPSAHAPAETRIAPPAKRKVPPARETSARSIRELAETTVRHCLAEALRTPVDKIDRRVTFSDYGVDSILGVGFVESINSRLALSLNPAIIFDYTTVERLAAFLVEHHAAELNRVASPEPSGMPDVVGSKSIAIEPGEPAREARVDSELQLQIDPAPVAAGAVSLAEIAVVGMAGQFPGATDVESFWTNLISGRNGVTRLPENYLDAAQHFGTGAAQAPECEWAGVLAERDCFDPLFFNISPREADSMNPHQRLVLQESWKALEDAGYDPMRLSGTNVGVYIGSEPSGYFHETFTGSSEAIIASRLSYFANLSGPTLVVNTACSSSASAIHLACEALRSGQVDMAIAGGVNASLSQAALVPLAATQMLSPTGRCRTFDESANGTVLSEAVGIVVLKRLDRAVADRDHIAGVICGSGMNQDGASNGITAPNGLAQERLIKDVYSRFAIDPASIEYVEAHGTGTRLGDPVEANALVRAFRHFTDRTGYCALGSAKSHVGHAAAGAGVTGLIKVLLSLKHARIPGLLHFETLNSLVDLRDSAFYINRDSRDWQASQGRPRMAALNSFGHSGTNVHLVIREHFAPPQPATVRPRPVLVPLSARREDVLKRYAEKMLDYLGEHESLSITDMAYTLQVGREAMSHRVMFLANDVAQLRQQIRTFLGGSVDGVNSWSGQVGGAQQDTSALLQEDDLQQLLATWLQQGKLDKIAHLWVRGAEIHWPELWSDQAARRISLPTYPFLKNRHGKDSGFISRRRARESIVAQSASVGGATAWAHPLAQHNTSTLEEQRFTSRLTGEEFFLRDHRVNAQPVLPGVAYLEMARAAVRVSLGEELEDSTHIQLKNIVWQRPLVVAEAQDVHVGLSAEENGDIELEIYTRRLVEGVFDDIVHVQGRAVLSEVPGEAAFVDVAALRSLCTESLEVERCYQMMAAAGVDLGPAMRGLTDLRVGTDAAGMRCVLARVVPPASVSETSESYLLHPSVLDGALQASIAFASADSPLLPFALEQLEIFERCPAVALVCIRPAGTPAAGAVQKLDVEICDEAGKVCVRLGRLTSRALGSSSPEAPQPLVQASPSASTETSVSRRFLGSEFFLKDHQQLLPAVAYLEIARAAGAASQGREVVGIRNVIWRDLLQVSESGAAVRIALSAAGTAQSFEVSVADGSAKGTVYAQGALSFDAGQRDDSTAPVDLESIRARCSQRRTGSECDRIIGAAHGKRMLPIEWLAHNADEALAQLRLPQELAASADDYVLHPSLLHGAVIAAVCLAALQDGGAPVRFPYALERLWIHSRMSANCFVHVRPSTTGDKSEKAVKYDIDVLNEDGTPSIVIRGFTAIAAPGTQAVGALYAAPSWQARSIEAPVAPVDSDTPLFILTEENAGLRRALEGQWHGAKVEALAPLGAHPAAVIEANFIHVMNLLKERIAAKPTRRQPIVVLSPENEHSYAHAAFAGLLKTAAMENSKLLCKFVRYSALESAEMPQWWSGLRAELAAGSPDVEVRYQAGNREVRPLKEVRLRTGRDVADVFHPGDVLWITGGLGGLGKIFARHFGAVRGVKIVVSGRSELDDAARATLQEIRERGVDVHYRRCDVANAQSVRELAEAVQREIGSISSIIHCAGVVRDGYLADKSVADAQAVLAPKIAGLLALDVLSQSLDLDYLVLCSSMAAGGNAGQADYAGANSFLDEFAHHRNELARRKLRKGHTLSVNWPLWREGGMQVSAQLDELRVRLTGMHAMDTLTGIQALLAALLEKHSQILVAQGDLKKMRAVLLQERTGVAGAPAPAPAHAKAAPPERTGSAAFSERVLQELTQRAGALLTLDVSLIDPQTDLARYGFDSISLTEFANDLNRGFDLELMPTVFFECSNLSALGQYLLQHHEAALRAKLETPSLENAARRPAAPGAAGAAPAVAATAVPASAFKASVRGSSRAQRRGRRVAQSHADSTALSRGIGARDSASAVPEPIAVIGMSGVFPQSPDLESFWLTLAAGRDCIAEIPPERWDWRAIYGDPDEGGFKTQVKWGGFIDSALSFDPLFFGISPREAESMDPQQRLLMTYAWKVIEDAGYAPSSLAGTRTAVFAGTADTGYSTLVARASQSIEGFSGTGLAQSVGPNRVSFLLDLRGPSEPIDTACSSSLVAIHRAVNTLRAGQCDLAIAGGVNTILTPTVHVGYAKAGMLSGDGRCKAFGDGADGFVRGEGAGMLLLKRLRDAERDGDQIHGVILHIGENHGGRAASLTAPNMKAQADLIRSVYEEAQIDPRTVTYVEAHGTGTQLGDPVELNGLKSAFGTLYERTMDSPLPAGRCGVGSVKSNIGHLELAAGVAGVIKVLLQMKHRRLVRSLHCQELNPYIDFTDSPFYVVGEEREWTAPRDAEGRELPRRAGVSSFGFAGVNAHALLEEYRDSRADRAPPAGPYVFVLSARTAEQLEQQARNLLSALESGSYREQDVARIAYTLQVGRDALRERLGFIAHDMAQTTTKLRAFLRDEPEAAGIRRGRVKAGAAPLPPGCKDNEELRESFARAAEQGEHETLVELWVRGGTEWDWSPLYRGGRPIRVSLPTYPFSQEKYWAFEAPIENARPEVEQPAHPAPPASERSSARASKQHELPPFASATADESARAEIERSESQPSSGETTLTLTPVWDPVTPENGGAELAETRFACVGLESAAVRNLVERAASAVALNPRPDDTIEELARRFEQLGTIDHIVWAFHNPAESHVAADSIIAAQRTGVLLCFKVIKALIALGYQRRKLGWTVLTEQTVAVSESDPVVAVHAGVHGLVGSLAKENPEWSVRVIDLSAHSEQSHLLSDCLALPAPQMWEDAVWAHRNGSWYRQRLLNFEMVHA